jgi:hypothetical protein
MARPKPQQELIKFALRLNPTVYRQIVDYAQQQDISINTTINSLCHYALEQIHRVPRISHRFNKKSQ